ncbi:MAG: DUF6268 family outer membrane beta-barrel protein [Salibacteraceae bacterium]|jgi:hypothetical protein|nr:DUF6268 family outer membrane beta-barrel protein [Salibacteraceae bacterium]MDP4763084.1 DUF6268 family outer membrane beta-barrel protein [Salibacteraceae bacterium]
MKPTKLLLLAFLVLPTFVFSQEDSTIVEEEEDYSIYDNLDFVDGSAKRFANAKIKGISPAKLITLGYDYQMGYDMTAGMYGIHPEETATINATHGVRVEANIPVISKNNLVVQLGARVWDINYDYKDASSLTHPLHSTLANHNLRSIGLNSTIFKPLSEKAFILIQLAADMNGDFAIPEFQKLKYNRYSGAALWGKRPSDNKQWAIGVSRTYRAGELNYIPVILYNWTSMNNTWGTEILFPARAHVRYTVNPRNMLFAGFELEGNSYRVGNQSPIIRDSLDSIINELEIRRGELRFRFVYERQLIGFFWISAQAGYRVNYSYNVDNVPNGTDFYRGFFGDQPLSMQNTLTNPLYFNVSINLVSP